MFGIRHSETVSFTYSLQDFKAVEVIGKVGHQVLQRVLNVCKFDLLSKISMIPMPSLADKRRYKTSLQLSLQHLLTPINISASYV